MWVSATWHLAAGCHSSSTNGAAAAPVVIVGLALWLLWPSAAIPPSAQTATTSTPVLADRDAQEQLRALLPGGYAAGKATHFTPMTVGSETVYNLTAPSN